MIINFQSMINKYGFISNGGRIYYLNRSQPPYFYLCYFFCFYSYIWKSSCRIWKEIQDAVNIEW
jgi:neutral trehalase